MIAIPQIISTTFNKAKYHAQKYPLGWILGLSLLVRIVYLLINYPLWWDSYVYMSMGKYIFSGGKIGLWESFRPLIHPLILGTLWKLKLDVVLIGKILDVIFSLSCIYLLYRIAEKVYNRSIAIISAILFSLTSIFITFTGLILTEPLAILFALAGIYCLCLTWLDPLKYSKIYLLMSGLGLGLSFLTKYPQGILFAIAVLLLWVYSKSWKDKFLNTIILSIGFLLLVLPYLYLNFKLYGNPFLPFIQGSWIMTTSTWKYGSGFMFYIFNFFFKNTLYLLFIPAIYLFFRNKEWKKPSPMLILLSALFILIYFWQVPRKEVRYLVFALPFLAMLSSMVIYYLFQKFQTAPKKILKPKSVMFLFILLLILPLPWGLCYDRQPVFEKELNQIIAENNINGTILSSDPSFIFFLDLPSVTLDGMEFAPQKYAQQKDKYELIFLNDCDLECPLTDNYSCLEEREQLLTKMFTENSLQFNYSHNNCTYSILLPKH